MIYVFNKNKILSYVLASCFVLTLFAFNDSKIQNGDIELVEVSSNVVENNILNNDNVIDNETINTQE